MRTTTSMQVIGHGKTDDWETPRIIFGQLDMEFHFNLDPCCTERTRKCENYFTPEQDGLKQSWAGYTVFCNPPYSNVAEWVKKAFEETKNKNTTVVMLIPSRTDTKYFHKYIYHRSEIRFIKGRLKFGNAKNPAPFPSMVVIFRGENE